jgi:hypothetical protein
MMRGDQGEELKMGALAVKIIESAGLKGASEEASQSQKRFRELLLQKAERPTSKESKDVPKGD